MPLPTGVDPITLEPLYVIQDECIPFNKFLDTGTINLRNQLELLATPFSYVLADSCDIAGAIDSMLKEGAAELKKGLAYISKVVGEMFGSIADFFEGSLLDSIYDAAEEALASIMSGFSSVINATMQILSDLQSMLLNAVQGIKDVLCFSAMSFLESVPAALVAGSIAANTIKQLNLTTKMISEGDIGSIMADVTDGVLKASGIDATMTATKSTEQILHSEITKMNDLANMFCEGSYIKKVDDVRITKDIIEAFG